MRLFTRHSRLQIPNDTVVPQMKLSLLSSRSIERHAPQDPTKSPLMSSIRTRKSMLGEKQTPQAKYKYEPTQTRPIPTSALQYPRSRRLSRVYGLNSRVREGHLGTTKLAERMRRVLRTHTTLLFLILRSLLSLNVLIPDTSSVEFSLCNFQLSLELLDGERFVGRVDRLDGVHVSSTSTRRGGEGGGMVRVERAATGRIERFVVVGKNGPGRFAARKEGVLRSRGAAFD
jgi:hypothetical protein